MIKPLVHVTKVFQRYSGHQELHDNLNTEQKTFVLLPWTKI